MKPEDLIEDFDYGFASRLPSNPADNFIIVKTDKFISFFTEVENQSNELGRRILWIPKNNLKVELEALAQGHRPLDIMHTGTQRTAELLWRAREDTKKWHAVWLLAYIYDNYYGNGWTGKAYTLASEVIRVLHTTEEYNFQWDYRTRYQLPISYRTTGYHMDMAPSTLGELKEQACAAMHLTLADYQLVCLLDSDKSVLERYLNDQRQQLTDSMNQMFSRK